MSARVSVVVIGKEGRVEREGQQVSQIWSRLRPEERDMTVLTCVCERFGGVSSNLDPRSLLPRVHLWRRARSGGGKPSIGIANCRRRFVDEGDYQSAPAAKGLCCSIVGAAAASSGLSDRAANAEEKRTRARCVNGGQNGRPAIHGREKRNCRQSRDRWSCELALAFFSH